VWSSTSNSEREAPPTLPAALRLHRIEFLEAPARADIGGATGRDLFSAALAEARSPDSRRSGRWPAHRKAAGDRELLAWVRALMHDGTRLRI